MSLQTCRPCERFPALLAHVRLRFFGMQLRLMNLSMLFCLERLAAGVAGKQPDIGVLCLMQPELCPPDKLLVADIALVRALSGMNTHVLDVRRALCE